MMLTEAEAKLLFILTLIITMFSLRAFFPITGYVAAYNTGANTINVSGSSNNFSSIASDIADSTKFNWNDSTRIAILGNSTNPVNLNITSDGILTAETNSTFIANGNIFLNGNMTVSNVTITVNGNVSISAPNSYINFANSKLTINGSWTDNSTSTFWNSANSSVTFTSPYNQTMAFGNATNYVDGVEFNNLMFDPNSSSANPTFTVAGNALKINGTLTIKNAAGDATHVTTVTDATNDKGITVKKALTVGGNGTLIFSDNPTTSNSLFTFSVQTNGTLTTDNSTITISTGGAGGAFSIAGGTWNMGSGLIQIVSATSSLCVSGTVNAGTSLISVTGFDFVITSCTGARSLNNLTFSSRITLSGNDRFLGNVTGNLGCDAVNWNGAILTVDGTFTTNCKIYGGGAPQVGGVNVTNLFINTSGYAQWSSTSHTISGAYTDNSTNPSNNWDAGSGTVSFTSTNSVTMTFANLGENEFNNLVFNPNSASANPTFTIAGSALNINGTLTIKNPAGVYFYDPGINVTLYSLNISNASIFRLDSAAGGSQTLLKFIDLNGTGFSSNVSGSFIANGNKTFGVLITTNNTTAPANAFNFKTGIEPATFFLNYTNISFANAVDMNQISNSSMVSNVVIKNSTIGLRFLNGGGGNFTNISFFGVSQNIVNARGTQNWTNISFDSSATSHLEAIAGSIEINTVQNLNSSKISWLNTSPGTLIIKNFNSIGDWRMYAYNSSMQNSKSSIKNDFTSADNITIFGGTFIIDKVTESKSFTISNGTTVNISSGNLTVSETFNQTGNLNIYNHTDVVSTHSIINESALFVSSNSSFYANNFNLNESEIRIYGDFHYTSTTPQVPKKVDDNDDGLVGLWHMDESYGRNSTDSSGNGNNGFLINGANWTSGRFKSALEFDGVDDSLEVFDNNSLDLTVNGTLVAWVKPKLIDRYQTIIAKGRTTVTDNLYSLFWWNDNEVLMSINNNTPGLESNCKSVTQLSQPDVWYFIVGTMNPSSLKIYVNGELKTECSKPYNITPTTYNLTIGISKNGDYPFAGVIDEAVVYNRDLSADEIKNLYGLGLIKHRTITAVGDANITVDTGIIAVNTTYASQ